MRMVVDLPAPFGPRKPTTCPRSTEKLTPSTAGTWLALYGAGVTAGGTFSLRAVRWMGLALLVMGGLALWMPQQGIVFLAAGFGVMHILFGIYLVGKHGG